MESTFCWKHLLRCGISQIFPALTSHLPLHCAFSPVFFFFFSCVYAPIHSHSFASYYSFCLIDWKFIAFHAASRSLSHQSCIFWSHLLHMVCSPFFSASSSLPISRVCMFWGAHCPKHSRLCHLAHGAKESGVRSSQPTNLTNIPCELCPRVPKKSWAGKAEGQKLSLQE